MRGCMNKNETKTIVTDEDYFVRGHCRAEMKKHVQYEVNIKLSLRGDIEETNCECTVGHSTSAHFIASM